MKTHAFRVQPGQDLREEIDRLALKIWDYHHMHHELRKADALFTLGSNDLRVADYAAKLFLDGWAPLMVFSGTGFGHAQNVDLLSTGWTKPEAEMFAEIVLQRGVPQERILIEDKSTNTGENVFFTKKLLEEKGIMAHSFILVQKPYMERRAFATFKKVWPDSDIVVTSPPIPFSEYPNEELPRDIIINIMVGDLQRIREYPKKGFQIEQDIPESVWRAYEQLVEAGYTKHLITE